MRKVGDMRASTLVAVLGVVGLWMLFTKANVAGYKAVIPFYNRYVMCQLSGHNNLFKWYLISEIAFIIAFLMFYKTGIIDMVSFLDTNLYDSGVIAYIIGSYLVLFAAMLICLLATQIVVAIINYHFIKCFTSKDIYVALATIGSLAMLQILRAIVYLILGFNNDIAYMAPDKDEH